MHNLVILAGSSLLSIAIVYLTLQIARKYSLVAYENDRSSHTGKIPLGGGVGVVISFLVGAFFFFYFGDIPSSIFYSLFFGSVLLATLSFYNDLYHIAPLIRLLFQLIVVVVCFSIILIAEDSFQLDITFLTFVFVVFCCLWWLNAFNFMDGTDGIAAIEIVSVCASICILFVIDYEHESGESNTWFLDLVLLLIVTTLGFLSYNWSPAKIFLGDVGSVTAAFILFMLVIVGWISIQLNPVALVIPAGFFVVDSSFTLIRRMIAGEKFVEAHRSHAYQRLSQYLQQAYQVKLLEPAAARTRSHRTLCYLLTAINFAWLLPWSMMAQSYPEFAYWAILAAWLPISIFVAKWSSAAEKEFSVKN